MLPACRLYVLTAATAASAVVLRRGPSDWWHLLDWNLDTLALTPGAWFHGTLYPRRCDISADGRLFGYFALKMSSGTPGWPGTYFAVSKVPWLEALAAWETCGTWTWGCRFSGDGDLEVRACIGKEPFHGRYPGKFAIGAMSVEWAKRDVSNEIKRGWQFAPAGDPLILEHPGRPNPVLKRERPCEEPRLTLGMIHCGVDFSRGGMEGVQVEYFLQQTPEDVTPVPEAAWADWDKNGRLLMATRDGELAVCRCHGTEIERIWSANLRERTPDPRPAPSWAGRW
ncbi:MAG TPA: hypothetical protein VJN43_19880 [Bryobacteraceae bacterium]|nr:hypothetical protein [Bryobacteraceae bacterium]